MAEKLWRVEQLSTMGWALIDERAVRLTKAAAKLVLERMQWVKVLNHLI